MINLVELLEIKLTIRFGLAIIYLVVGLILARFIPYIFARMTVRSAQRRKATPLSERRIVTLDRLARHVARAFIILLTILFIMSSFVDSGGLLTFLGLFSAAFGFGSRAFVSDYISGVIFLYEDQYNVGEKVEITGIEGTVLEVNLRTTVLRAMSGELYIIPNGEVRTVRNFGRGEFSLASLRFAVPTDQFEEAFNALTALAPTLPQRIDTLLEPPRVLTEDSAVTDKVQIIVFAKAQYAHGVETRNALLPILSSALRHAAVDAIVES